jgi:hypothetical protein
MVVHRLKLHATKAYNESCNAESLKLVMRQYGKIIHKYEYSRLVTVHCCRSLLGCAVTAGTEIDLQLVSHLQLRDGPCIFTEFIKWGGGRYAVA